MKNYRSFKTGPSFCAAAISAKSITGGRVASLRACTPVHDSASATGLSMPLMCWMLVVNQDMKSVCLIWCGQN